MHFPRAPILTHDIQEASAVQRAKRALREQLRLRGEAARQAKKLREEARGMSVETERDPAAANDGDLVATELAELEKRIASGSTVCVCLYTSVLPPLWCWLTGGEEPHLLIHTSNHLRFSLSCVVDNEKVMSLRQTP